VFLMSVENNIDLGDVLPYLPQLSQLKEIVILQAGSYFTGGAVVLQVGELLYRSGSCFTGGFKSVTVRKASVTKINHF
jgi:hypothetical protein